MKKAEKHMSINYCRIELALAFGWEQPNIDVSDTRGSNGISTGVYV